MDIKTNKLVFQAVIINGYEIGMSKAMSLILVQMIASIIVAVLSLVPEDKVANEIGTLVKRHWLN